MISVDNDTIRFLIIDASAEAAEALLNFFRESGYSTRAGRVNSQDELDDALTERWDLLLVSDPSGFTSVQQIIDSINQKDVDLPAIIFSDEDHFTFLKLGARAVVPVGQDEHLLTVVQKEMADLKTRRHHRRMSIALHESEKQRRLLLDDQVDAIVYVNHGCIQYANAAFLKLLGAAEDFSLDGEPFKNLITADDQQDVDAFLLGVEESGQALAVIQCPLVTHDGAEIDTRAVISATSFNGEFTLSLQIKPIELAEAEQQPEQPAAENDAGLVEQAQFDQALSVAIQRAVSGKGSGTLCCIHVETFKAIDERHGQQVSETFLKTVAHTLATHFTSAQPLASIGAGNFAVLLRDGGEQEVKSQVESLPGSLTNVAIDGHSLAVRLSLGAVLLNENSSDANRLMLHARQATVQAQKNGGSQLVIYQKQKADAVRAATRQLAGMVSQALKNNQFRLSYQPVISLAGSASEYYEVSSVMTDAEGREHPVSVFRPKLEKTVLWSKLDRWQLIEASKELMTKRRQGTDTRLLVHVGGFSVTDDAFLPWMKVALETAGIPAEAVAIQLSEQNLARYPQEVPGFFAALKAMGCQRVISEFGCSLNPLEAIANLDVDWVKLDRSFAEGLRKDGSTKELQKMIEALGKSGKKVVVPGIESAAEMTPVWQFGADFIQGGYVQPPANTMDFDFGSDS